MSYNEIALQRAGKQHKSELAAKDAEIAALREALGSVANTDLDHPAGSVNGDKHYFRYILAGMKKKANKALEVTK